MSRVDTERAWRSWGLVAGGAGAVSLVLAIGYGLHAETLSDHVSRRYDSKLASEGETANQVAMGGWITGGVLVTAGAVMYWYGSTHAGRADRVTLAPTISERGAGLVIAGAFR